MKESLPGIVRIFYVKCSALHQQIPQISISGIPLAVLSDFFEINFVGEATLVSSDENENNGRSEKAILKFRSVDDIPNVPVAFIVSCANGACYLIGANERPYPSVKKVKQYSASEAINEFEVSYSAKKALVDICIAG